MQLSLDKNDNQGKVIDWIVHRHYHDSLFRVTMSLGSGFLIQSFVLKDLSAEQSPFISFSLSILVPVARCSVTRLQSQQARCGSSEICSE
jgi:hypothetical protein